MRGEMRVRTALETDGGKHISLLCFASKHITGKAEEECIGSNSEINYRKLKARVQIGFIKADGLIFNI